MSICQKTTAQFPYDVYPANYWNTSSVIMEENKILTSLNIGLRSEYSLEAQLVTTIHHIFAK